MAEDKEKSSASASSIIDSIKYLMSGLYNNFIIYDITYTFAGVIILISVGYAYYGCMTKLLMNLKQIQSAFQYAIFFGASYFVGIVSYNTICAVCYHWYAQKAENKMFTNNLKEIQDPQILLHKIKTTLKESCEDIFLETSRGAHFEVASLAIASAFFASFLLLCFLPFIFKPTWKLGFIVISFILSAISFYSYYRTWKDNLQTKKNIAEFIIKLETVNSNSTMGGDVPQSPLP